MSRTIVLHIGTGKAGSSTLQRSLHAARKSLLRQGILIPQFNGRYLDQSNTLSLFTKDLPAKQWDTIAADVEHQIRTKRPHTVILSSEHLCARKVEALDFELINRLGADELKLVLIVREPTSFYLSNQQQRLRATHTFTHPRQFRAKYKDTIQNWRSLGHDLSVIPFQKPFATKDMVANFLSLVAPDDSIDYSATVPTLSTNTSECAEVTAIMQNYFRALHFGERRRLRPEAHLVREALIQASKRCDGVTKPKLKPYVSRIIVDNHREELDWLRAEENIEFDLKFDKHSVSERDADHASIQSFSDIATVNNDAVTELQLSALRQFALRETGKRRTPTQTMLRKLFNSLLSRRA